ncbi:LacI family DNA-binding transcriptional regulator [uncultured Victivallis sp.]|uniref:LacI family DNA-binding transcriptional regulator n=1 Tax=uncultured Victivallis sp. TaxID=354118 RepID=UPI0025F80B17|nr:LacI family DNA-binding transcriptional regulator [uncultured Victivallis sp.]
MKSKVSLNDVARHAGVSIGTASRVLNGNPKVSESACHAVQTAILELGYQPDSAARSMRKKEAEGRNGLWSGNVGLVLAGMGSSMLHVPLVIDLVDTLQWEMTRQGFHLMVSELSGDSTLPQMLIDRKVEGMIVFGELSTMQGRWIADSMPVVGIGNNFSTLGIPSVNVDNRQSILNAVNELHRAGRRRIAFVNREPGQLDFARRYAAYQEAVHEFGLPELAAVMPQTAQVPLKQAEQVPPDMTPLIAQLFDGTEIPDALLVANDWQAIGVYRALAKRGLRPGTDLAVIGFDNEVRICESLQPRLSSIQYPAHEIARTAFRLLQNALCSPDTIGASSTLLPGKLVERDSFRMASDSETGTHPGRSTP